MPRTTHYADSDTHHPVRAGVVQDIMENPKDGRGPRHVLADWLEEKCHPLEVPQLLREDPGHWELRDNNLYWVLDSPCSEWTREYLKRLAREAKEGGWPPLDEPPYKWLGHVWHNPKCVGCKYGVGSGRWLPNKKTGKGTWICNNCWRPLQRFAEALDKWWFVEDYRKVGK
jgi:hypothetical protein